MVDRKKNFYLFGNAEDGSCTPINALVANLADQRDLSVLNRHRGVYKELIALIEKNGLSGETSQAISTIPQVSSFGGFIGLRNFFAGKELGHLDESGIPGVLFYRQKTTPQLGLKDDTNIKLVRLERLEDDLDVVTTEIEEVIGLAGQKANISDEELQSILEKQIANGYIRTGLLTVELMRKRVLYKERQLDIDPLDYVTIECMARHMRQFVSAYDLSNYHHAVNSERRFSDELMQGYLKRAASKINRSTDQSIPYVERAGSDYKLEWRVPPRTIPGPEVLENGPLYIDFTNKKVWMDNNYNRLLDTSFNFLTILADNIGEFVPRAEIIEKVWPAGIDPTVFPKILNNLRRLYGDGNTTENGLILHRKGPKNGGVQLRDLRNVA